uniref:Uncharacterized protein n=1 Tax=Candidatus Kentrum sp. FW TaxID=2126338 RepID=A0A450SIB0_9GAMM|nr:MAG: hypothetical protein BECKFW1821A_GA0114235_10404 [Candidatus Kentron sp. FW]
MAAVIRSLLKTECLEVGSYFMLVTIKKLLWRHYYVRSIQGRKRGLETNPNLAAGFRHGFRTHLPP